MQGLWRKVLKNENDVLYLNVVDMGTLSNPLLVPCYLCVVVPSGAGVPLEEVDSPAQEDSEQGDGEAGEGEDDPEWHGEGEERRSHITVGVFGVLLLDIDFQATDRNILGGQYS